MKTAWVKISSLVATAVYLFMIYALTIRMGEPITNKMLYATLSPMESFTLVATSCIVFTMLLMYNHETKCCL